MHAYFGKLHGSRHLKNEFGRGQDFENPQTKISRCSARNYGESPLEIESGTTARREIARVADVIDARTGYPTVGYALVGAGDGGKEVGGTATD